MLGKKAREFVSSLSVPPGSHDLLHTKRVVVNARKIWEEEGGDWDVLEAAAWLHDVSLLMGGSKEAHHEDSAKIAENVLLGLPGAEKVARIIREHRYSLGIKPSCKESAILQDADKLDALGAIGIYRTIAYGVKSGYLLYDSEDPFAVERELNDKKYTVDHFFVKLLRLPLLMNTETGRKLALERVRIMLEFLRALEEELGFEGDLRESLKKSGLEFYLAEGVA